MKQSDYRETVYKLGIPIRLRELESEAQALQRDYPEFFLSETPVVLLRPEHRNGGWGGARVSNNGASSKAESNNGHKPVKSGISLSIRAQREKTAAMLNWIDGLARRTATVPQLRKHGVDMRGVNALVNAGHLTKRGKRDDAIYTRTRTTFTVGRPGDAAPPKKKIRHEVKHYGAAALQRREQSAKLLTRFDTEEPRPAPREFLRSMGSYVRRGYLRQQGRGLYVRTAKQYEVQPT